MARPTSVTLLSGFLGSGKTTLLNRILRADHGLSVAVLVNDFGDVSIDAELVVGVEDGAITLANGCICCTIKDDLIAAVQRVLRRDPRPDHIVVEMSGISEPRAVLLNFRMMERSWPLSIDAVLAVVDAEQFPEPNDRHYLLAREQIAVADVILLNKIDLCDAGRVAALRARLQSYVPDARIIESAHADAPLELLIGVGSRATIKLLDPALAQEQGAHAHDHAEAFSTFTYVQQRPLSLERLRRACVELPHSVYRAKGLVFLDAQPDYQMLLQVVGRRASITRGEPWPRGPRTTIVCVGDAGGIDVAALSRAFDACVAGRVARFSQWLRAVTRWPQGRPNART